MKFECPDCGQHLAMETMHAGQAVKCPACGANITAPAPAATPSAEVIKTLQSNIDRGNMTISQYMAEQQIEGGVDLTASDTGSTASGILTAEQGRKYKLGNAVAQGGMGAILDAKDINLRRGVAMKVILEPVKAGKDQILRFIQEAQVTSQLEHPSIVPVHELGVDASGNVFYTMKFVHGRTLKDILKKIGEDDAQTIKDYPLSHLLNIFQKVCDAMAFAHSKRVIHRDLKPENVMVGDYGEVQVMDWGLAKVLPRKKRKTLARNEGGNLKPEKGDGKQDIQVSGLSPQPSPAIDSVRGDAIGEVLNTMDGSIMGTPGFMSPEQALGETEKIDERTDIYALGAILYNILTLDVPVKGKNLADLINKVISGEIRKPTEYNRATTRPAKDEGGNLKPEKGSGQSEPSGLRSQVSALPSLPHCPDSRIPESLSAVAMKALEVEAHRRYQKVTDLQKEIEAYQGGFATGAEQASAWRQFQLFVKRNKALSVAALVVLLAVGAGGMISTTQWLKAQKALSDFKAEQTARTIDRKQSAPAMVKSAKMIAEQGDYKSADSLLQTAIEYDPATHEAYLLRTLVLVRGSNYVEAVKVCEEALRTASGDQDGNSNRLLDICRQLSEKGRNEALLMKLSNICQENGLPALAAAFALSPKEKLNLYRLKLAKEFRGKLTLEPDGNLKLDLCKISGLKDMTQFQGIPLTTLAIAETSVADLKPLTGMPLTVLDLTHSKVTDLAPLKGMLLTELSIQNTQVSDLMPLKDMPLITSLNIERTKVADLSPLKGMLLTNLYAGFTSISDLTPLKGMPLTRLSLSYTRVVDLKPLKGAPLTWLNLHGIQVSDLTPLRGMQLTMLGLWSTQVSDLSVLEGMPLTELLMENTRIKDIAQLKGKPLTILQLNSTQVGDLTSLKNIKLTEFYFTPNRITNGIEVVRNMSSIYKIGVSQDNSMPPAEFWKKYDAGEFSK